MSNQLTEDVNSHSNKHSQLKNNQQRPSSCCSRKAAPCNSHLCRLVLANNNLVPLRRETKCHLLGVILAGRTRHGSPVVVQADRVTKSPLLQHKAEGHCPGSDVSATAGSCSLLNSFPLPAVVLAQLMSIIFTLTLILYLLV